MFFLGKTLIFSQFYKFYGVLPCFSPSFSPDPQGRCLVPAPPVAAAAAAMAPGHSGACRGSQACRRGPARCGGRGPPGNHGIYREFNHQQSGFTGIYGDLMGFIRGFNGNIWKLNIHWTGLKENLQETIVFTHEISGFPVKCRIKQSNEWEVGIWRSPSVEEIED